MKWICALCVVLTGAVYAEDSRPERMASEELVLDDESSEHAFRVRWRLRGWSDFQVYQRAEWQRDAQRVFILHERDAGERWTDYFILHYVRQTRWGEVAAGDLQPKWAGGLVWGRGRHTDPTARWSLRDSRDLGYRSATENGSVRGVAWRTSVGRWRGFALVGRSTLDARRSDAGSITSLPNSGLHVTATELLGRDALRADVGGGGLARTWDHARVGFALQYVHFHIPLDLRRRGRTPWDFVGQRQLLTAVHALWRTRWGEWAAEIGGDAQGRWAGIAQWHMRRGDRFVRWQLRQFIPGFHAFFSAVPSGAGGLNERGVALVVGGREWEAYVERARRPERTYYVPRASTYTGWGGKVAWSVGASTMRLFASGRRRPYARDEQIVSERRDRLRLEWRRSDWMGQGQFVRWTRRGDRAEWGRLFGVRWQRLRNLSRQVVQLSVFHTGSYRSRLYEYEYDLPGAVSIRALYGRGARLMVLGHRRCKQLNVAVRYRLQRDVRWHHFAGCSLEWQSN